MSAIKIPNIFSKFPIQNAAANEEIAKEIEYL